MQNYNLTFKTSKRRAEFLKNSEYLFDSAAKKLVYALIRITPDMKIADKNSAARKYTFLPRVGSDILKFCGAYAKKLMDVQSGLRKATFIPFRQLGKTLYAAVIKEENGCLLMIFHPLFIFVGTSVNNNVLEKAIASCAEKLRLSATLTEKEKPSFPSSNEFLLAGSFTPSRINGKEAVNRLEEAIKALNFNKSVKLRIPNEDDIPNVFIEYSKLLYAFAEISSFALSLSSTSSVIVTVNFCPNFMTVIASGDSEHKMTSARKLYFDIFSTVMHCISIGARILKTREKSFEVAISIPYELPPKLHGNDTFSSETLQRMLLSVLEFYGVTDI